MVVWRTRGYKLDVWSTFRGVKESLWKGRSRLGVWEGCGGELLWKDWEGRSR